jgi:hypothetical protein
VISRQRRPSAPRCRSGHTLCANSRRLVISANVAFVISCHRVPYKSSPSQAATIGLNPHVSSEKYWPLFIAKIRPSPTLERQVLEIFSEIRILLSPKIGLPHTIGIYRWRITIEKPVTVFSPGPRIPPPLASARSNRKALGKGSELVRSARSRQAMFGRHGNT